MRLRLAAVVLLPFVIAAGACGPIGGSAAGSGDDSSEGGASSGSSLPAIGMDGGILMAPNGYYVKGNQVLDAQNKAHIFRGLDRPSLEWSPSGSNLTPTDYVNMAQKWHANVVRISLNQDFWLNDPSNTSYDQGYQAFVDEQVKDAEMVGLDVILDLHWSDQGDFSKGVACLNLPKGAACQQCMADTHSNTFWQQVATKYAGDGHVLFELYNEPHDVGWNVWLNGGISGGSCSQNGGNDFMVVGMQTLYNTIRATGANNVVIVGGLNWSYDLSEVPSYRVQGYNVMYNTHPYSSKCGGTCSTAAFDHAFGFLAATDPVIATEFGNNDCTAPFYTTFTGYAEMNGLHWTAWAYFVAGCSFPSVIVDWSGTPQAGSGTTVQSALMASSGPLPVVVSTADAGSDAPATSDSGDASNASDAATTDGSDDGGD